VRAGADAVTDFVLVDCVADAGVHAPTSGKVRLD
jgi:hypothetical protein